MNPHRINPIRHMALVAPILLRSLLALLVLLGASQARAQLTIDVVGGGANQISVALYPFNAEAGQPQPLTPVIAADLHRSGRFKLYDTGQPNPLPTDPAQVNLKDWGARSTDAVVIGTVVPAANGRLEVRFWLLDAAKQTQIGGLAYTIAPNQLRATAHRIADYIYEKMTGDKGVFSTRIAYVVKQGSQHELSVADADGFGAAPVLRSPEPIMSPTWSPDGTRLAYVSFQQKKPVVYVQRLNENRQLPVANFKGSNSAPAWSPDGRNLAVVLTRDGNSQIYMIGAEGGGARRLSNSNSIDTEPVFSPDGQSIYFTSDRGGSPQIYRMAATGGDARRVTFEGSYNVSPRISADGKSLVYISREGGRFQVAVLDLASNQRQLLTDGSRDESPSFAPNGKMILYATDAGGRGTLAAVSIDGRVKQRLSTASGDVREPAWGPLVDR